MIKQCRICGRYLNMTQNQTICRECTEWKRKRKTKISALEILHRREKYLSDLEKTVREAEKEGLSYGQYVGLQYAKKT